jgi:hypothetical protein
VIVATSIGPPLAMSKLTRTVDESGNCQSKVTLLSVTKTRPSGPLTLMPNDLLLVLQIQYSWRDFYDTIKPCYTHVSHQRIFHRPQSKHPLLAILDLTEPALVKLALLERAHKELR